MPRIFLVKVGHRTARQKFGPPLGIMMLDAYLRRKMPGVELKLRDMLPDNLTIADLVREIRDYQPDILGISAMTYESEEMAALAKAGKAFRPDLPRVGGW